MKRIAIVGTRKPLASRVGGTRRDLAIAWEDYEIIRDDVLQFIKSLPADVSVVSGGAVGVDSIADEACARLGLRFHSHRPDYDRYGKQAPLIRNQLIVDDADEIHAWPSSWSRGTWDTIRKAEKAGKPVTVHRPWEERK